MDLPTKYGIFHSIQPDYCKSIMLIVIESRNSVVHEVKHEKKNMKKNLSSYNMVHYFNANRFTRFGERSAQDG